MAGEDDNKITGDIGEGKAGPGRPKGALNKTTRAAKDAIALAAEALGGTERLAEWAKEDTKNEAAFWTQIYTKLIPLKLGGDPDNPLKHIHQIELVGVAASHE